MRWTVDGVHVGTVFGIPIVIQNSVFATAPLIAFMLIMAGSTRSLAINLVVLALIIASIIAHELAHVQAARLFGVPVRHVALTWFGGFAEFWLTPTSRWREAGIALAGPTSNLAIAAVTLLLVAVFFPAPPVADFLDGDIYWRWRNPQYREPAALEIIRRVGWFNLGLGLFNLSPGLPLDGGHVLRAILSRSMSRGRASWIACWLGVLVGGGVVVAAFVYESLWALAIGAFVVLSAWLEKKRLRSD